MKKYVLKSVIIFTMILILGLILIPMIPTEKEVIESDITFDLIFDINIDSYYHTDDFIFSSYDYKFYFFQYVNVYGEVYSMLFNVDYGNIVAVDSVLISIVYNELEIDVTGYFRIWGVSK